MNPDDGAGRWDRIIPHYDLSPESLPTPGASWDELVYFAGTWDRYIVLPDAPVALQDLAEDPRKGEPVAATRMP